MNSIIPTDLNKRIRIHLEGEAIKKKKKKEINELEQKINKLKEEEAKCTLEIMKLDNKKIDDFTNYLSTLENLFIGYYVSKCKIEIIFEQTGIFELDLNYMS